VLRGEVVVVGYWWLSFSEVQLSLFSFSFFEKVDVILFCVSPDSSSQMRSSIKRYHDHSMGTPMIVVGTKVWHLFNFPCDSLIRPIE